MTEPSKPWLRYATALTAEQMAALLADGAVNLNLYITNECWVQVTIFRSDAGDIADSSVVESRKNYPIPGA